MQEMQKKQSHHSHTNKTSFIPFSPLQQSPMYENQEDARGCSFFYLPVQVFTASNSECRHSSSSKNLLIKILLLHPKDSESPQGQETISELSSTLEFWGLLQGQPSKHTGWQYQFTTTKELRGCLLQEIKSTYCKFCYTTSATSTGEKLTYLHSKCYVHWPKNLYKKDVESNVSIFAAEDH